MKNREKKCCHFNPEVKTKLDDEDCIPLLRCVESLCFDM